jgi:hypothetical protein
MESESIWVGLWPNAHTTRVVVMRGASETILRASLPLRPSSPRAVTTLFEAIALWEGRPVRAVLVADESSTTSLATTLHRDTFAIFGERTALYELQWVVQGPARRRRPVRGAMNSFGDLERLVVHTASR